MYISNKMVKMAGLVPSGTYDAKIIKVEEHFLRDYMYDNEHRHWFIHFKIMEKNKCRKHMHSMYCCDHPGLEFSEFIEDLRQVMNIKGHKQIKAEDIVNLPVSVKFGCMLEVSNPFMKEATMKNCILKIDKCHDDIKEV